MLCKLAIGVSVDAETVFDGMALCHKHFYEVGDVEFLDSVEREVVRETREKWEAGRWLLT